MTMDTLKRLLTSSGGKEDVEEEEVNALLPQGDHSEKKSKKQKGKNTLRKALLSGATEYGAQLVEQVIRASELDGNTALSQIQTHDNSPILQKLLEEFTKADEIINQCSSTTGIHPSITATSQSNSNDLLYQDYQPFSPTHLPPSITLLTYDTFNTALDTFYSHTEASKLLTKHIQAHSLATTRLTTAQKDHESRLTALRQTQELNVLKATLLERNLERVDEALRSVNGLLSRGMDWGDIERLVERERERGNVVAEMIVEMKFKEGTVILGLREDEREDEGESSAEETDEEGEEEGKGTKEVVKIEVDLGLSAYANARKYFDKKKVAAEKELRTEQSSKKALKNAERKINADLKRSLKEEKPLMKPLRENKWFEKFYWFISSEGYLIIGARDAVQSELLVRKYFRKGDIYVHSDLEGSSVVVIKNPIEDAVIPPGTLNQAGIMVVATSRAWDAKQVTSAWWVPYNQVEKREGGWDVKGKKNFLPPAMLVLGYAILWTTEDEETMERHARPLFVDMGVSQNAEEAQGAGNEETIEEEARQSNGESDAEGKGAGVKEPEDADVKDTDKYNLKDYGSASEAESETQQPESTTSLRQKQFLSAKQRRDLKKGTKPPADDVNELASSISSISVSKAKCSPPQVRGKRSKVKKVKAKYANQSDEERELARRLLGAKVESTPKSVEPDPPKFEMKSAPIVKTAQQERDRSAPRPMKSVVDETIEELDLSVKEFVAAPKSGDVISDAVTVCAPWSALTRYKYKVKLTPGATKKGKAARAIINGFLSMPIDETGEDPEKMSPREKELLTSLKDEDIIPCIWPKTVKVVGGKDDTGKGKKSIPAKGKGKK